MEQRFIRHGMFLTVVVLLTSCIWGGTGTQIPPGYEYPDQPIYHDPTPTPTDDPLHYPVQQPTAQDVNTPEPVQTESVIQLPPSESEIQSRAVATPRPCDINRDGKCNWLDLFAIYATARAKTATPRPATRPSSTPRPTIAASATKRPTATPVATLTATPTTRVTAMPSATRPPVVGSKITWPVSAFNYGDTPEKFNVVFAAVKAATAMYPDLPACNEADPNIHPITRWHGLVYFTMAGDTVQPICHYGHQHGIDPNSGNSIFGEPGAFLGVPGQSVSGPHQTFYVPASIDDPTITPQQLAAQGIPVQMENDVKHTGYKWYVSTGSTCSATDPQSEFYQRMCVTAFRVQFHAHSLADFHVRRHSFTFEGKVCADPFNEATCGIRRLAGWAEHNRLFTPPQDTRCWGEFQKDPPPGLVSLPGDEQFNPSPYLVDTPPRDEFRCHWNLSPAAVVNNLNGLRAVPEHMPFEWWIQTGGDTRLQIMSPNPIAGVDANGVALKPYCQQVLEVNPHLADMCRWTGQKLHINTGYIMATRAFNTFYFLNGVTINASDDADGDGVFDAKRWTTRFGEFRADNVCKTVSLDCLPDTWEGSMLTPHPLKRNPDGTAYIDPATGKRVTLPTGYLQGVKDIRPANGDTTVTIFDGDITPPGVRSWIAEAWQPMNRTFGPPLPDVQEVVEHAEHH